MFRIAFPSLLLIACFRALGSDAGTLSGSSTYVIIGHRLLLPQAADRSEYEGESLPIDSKTDLSLDTVLEKSPAITVQNVGTSESSSYFIRGASPTESRYFLEGIPLTDAEFNADNIVQLPLESLGAVDLYADGVPAFLGEDGLGGAIDFHLEDFDRVRKGEIGTRLGSYGYAKAYGKLKEGDLKLTADYARSNEDFYYLDDNGTPLNPSDDAIARRSGNEYQRLTLLPQVDLIDSDTQSLKLFSLDTFRDAHLPGPTSLPINGELNELFSLSALKYQGGLSQDWDHDSQVYVKVDNSRLDLSPDNPTPTTLPGVTQSRALTVGAKTRLLGHTDAWRYETSFGGNWDRFAETTPGPGNDPSPKNRLAIPVSLASELPLFNDRIALKPAVLSDYYHYSAMKGPVPSRDLWLLSPRMGLTYQSDPHWRVRSSIGHYFRAPTLFELYGQSISQSPNPQLGSESADKIDLGADGEVRTGSSWLRRVDASYTFGVSRAHDLIAYIQNSQDSDVSVNVGESRILFHEFSLRVDSDHGLYARSSLSLLQSTNLTPNAAEQGKELPHRPPYRWQSGVGFGQGPFRVEYVYERMGATYWDLANLKRLSATDSHSVTAQWDSRSLGTFALELDNLTDSITASSELGGVETIDNTSGYLGYPTPGRRVYLLWTYAI